MEADGCAICGSGLSARPAVRLNGASLLNCPGCGSWTHSPRVSVAQQEAAHDDEAYFRHPYFQGRRLETSAQRRRHCDLFDCLEPALGSTQLQGERWLDVGCDTGSLLRAAQARFGVVPFGIDVASRAIAIARQHGIEAYQSSLEAAPACLTGLRVVTAIDLIEHVTDPGAFLREVRRRLRPGGLLYLETPNMRSFVYRFGCGLSRLTGGRPASLIARLFPAQHLQYFNQESLAGLVRRSGLAVVRLWSRTLPASDISASPAVLAAIAPLQACDRVRGTGILLCAVLRRPEDDDDE